MSRAEKTEKPRKVRVFVGLRCSMHQPFKQLLTDLEQLANDKQNQLRLAPPQNLHVTLKFIGSVLESELGSIDSILKQCCARHQAMQLHCEGVGIFKNSIWTGIRADEALTAMAVDLDTAFSSLGISEENKLSYTPHMTVARFSNEAKTKIGSLKEKYAGQKWGEIQAKKLYLYRSDTLPEGARYVILSAYELAGTD
ncbi:MAG: RNA 2',3'-cyclic phosphodiesterase [Proteobacteria bacterium]|nr:RNA 2',3'-cyclic phosphodiesterase [Pseudomonadota bacterium]